MNNNMTRIHTFWVYRQCFMRRLDVKEQQQQKKIKLKYLYVFVV